MLTAYIDCIFKHVTFLIQSFSYVWYWPYILTVFSNTWHFLYRVSVMSGIDCMYWPYFLTRDVSGEVARAFACYLMTCASPWCDLCGWLGVKFENQSSRSCLSQEAKITPQLCDSGCADARRFVRTRSVHAHRPTVKQTFWSPPPPPNSRLKISFYSSTRWDPVLSILHHTAISLRSVPATLVATLR